MMDRKQFTGTDLMVSAICYGTATFGAGDRDIDVDGLLKLYRDAGGNFLDTAHCYAFWKPGGAGCSERAIGDYIRRNGKRDLVIGTKGGHTGAPGYRKTEHWLSPCRVEADIDDSLGRLGLDTIDLYWLHRDDFRVPVDEIIEMLNHEVQRGRIRWFGASNWRPERIAEANAYATAHGLQGFRASQTEFSLAVKNTRNPDPATDSYDGDAMLFLEDDDQKWHQQTHTPVVAYSSNAGGYFASEGSRGNGAYDNPISHQRLIRAQLLAKEINVTTGQVALAWLIHQPFPVFPIVGSCNPGHLRESLDAAPIHLTPEQADQLAQP